MKKLHILVSCTLLIIAIVLPFNLLAQTSSEAEIEQEIKDLLEKSQFNGSVLISSENLKSIQLNRGWTDHSMTKLLNSKSKFNVGSFAKEIPSVAIYDLIDENLLSYETTLDEIIKGLPKWSNKIKITDLLFYKSGLPTLNFSIVKNDNDAIKELSIIEELKFNPGTNYFYSNWNNFLLAKIVETITNTNFKTWINQRYFEKLNIDGAKYDSTVPKTGNNMTYSYSDEHGDDKIGNPKFKEFKLCYAPLYMTIKDVHKWIEFINEKYLQDGKHSKKFYEETTLQKQGPLGIMEHQNGKVRIHRHGGSSYSFGISTYRNYDKGLSIILMTNKDKGELLPTLNKEILTILNTKNIGATDANK